MAGTRPPLDRFTLAGLAAILLWASVVAVSRSLLEKVGPLTGACAVYGAGGLLCAAWLLLRPGAARALLRLPRPYLFACGGLFVFYMAALYLAVGRAADRPQVLQVNLVNYLWTTLTLLLAVPILRRRAGWPLLPGTLLALLGLALVLGGRALASPASFAAAISDNPLPFLLALAAALAWALYSTLTRRLAGEAAAGGVVLFIPATALALLLLRRWIPEDGAWSGRALAEAAFMAVATTLGYALWDLAMRRGNLTLVAAASYLTPLLATLLASLYLRVSPDRTLWIGCGLLVAGSLLSGRGVSEGPAESAVPPPREGAS